MFSVFSEVRSGTDLREGATVPAESDSGALFAEQPHSLKPHNNKTLTQRYSFTLIHSIEDNGLDRITPLVFLILIVIVILN